MPFATASLPGPQPRQRTLGESINVATRNIHTKLNRLIVARLPLALPPHTSDASLYVSGLLHIAPVYITFESLWQNLLTSPHTSDPSTPCDTTLPTNVGPGGGTHGNHATNQATMDMLRDLHLPGLMRSDRLRSDIRAITGWSPQVLNEQLKAVSREGRLSEFIRHIRRAVEKRPHVLISYSYILFMALFAGGRFLRATLESVADQDGFWEKTPSPVRPSDLTCHRSPRPPPSTPAAEQDTSTSFFEDRDTKHSTHATNPDGTALPLSFFHFAAPADGEELKHEFKKRLAAAEEMLGARERHDIVQEAICIFENMLLLVSQLDGVCGTNLDANANVDPIFASPAAFGARLRDSVVVAKERRAVAQSMSSEASDPEQYPNFKEGRHCNGHLHGKGIQSTSQHAKGASDDSISHDWHSAHHSSPSGNASDDQNECCALLSKSVRFEAKPPTLDRKQSKRRSFFSLDGPASRRESAECPAALEKNSLRDLPAANGVTAKTVLSNILLVTAVAALLGTMYFARSGGEETPEYLADNTG